ncbi:hypothetical protein D9R14_05775 [Xanthobacter tagetidis]|uniref:Uncharacterized protein n=1 Tax=Xanthobacter tagetidis TaxID=60216 RepID=A0A3L7AJ66_9HYPH|nr:hypothetical protein D9R14_05775 [Xanthobacter tagetidis]
MPDGLIPLIKSTARAAVAAAVVPGSTGPQRVEQLTGYSPGQISRWGGDAHKDMMPLEVVFLLEFIAQKPVFARALAALTGHRLVPIEEGDGGGCLTRDMLDITAAAGAVSQAYGTALADGTVTPREREEIRRAKRRLQDSLARAALNLAGLTDGEG